ncbi:MAG: hypothetical protein ACYTHM_15550 [Planctomycetota bacterium]
MRLVKEKRILTEDQIRKVVVQWEGSGGAGTGKKIWDVALDLGYLSPNAHAKIDEHLTFITLREEDKRLGAAAVSNGLIQSHDLEVSLIIQRKTHKEKKEVRRLEEILLEMGALTPLQLEAFRRAAKFREEAGSTDEAAFDELDTFVGEADASGPGPEEGTTGEADSEEAPEEVDPMEQIDPDFFREDDSPPDDGPGEATWL